MIVVASRAQAQSRRHHYTSPHGARAVIDCAVVVRFLPE
jgi:hypothetical protein